VNRHFSTDTPVINNHPATEISAHPPGRHDGDAAVHDRGPADGHCRGPRGPSILRAIPSLADSGRSADASSRLPQMEGAPNVPAPTCNDDLPVSNILRSKRIPGREEVRALHKRLLEAGSRYTPKSVLNSVLNSAMQSRLRAVRRASSSISSLVLLGKRDKWPVEKVIHCIVGLISAQVQVTFGHLLGSHSYNTR